METAPIAIAALVSQTMAGKEAQAMQRGVRLQLEALAEVTLNGDALLISQALTNLLDNAIDFTRRAGASACEANGGNSITASASVTTAAAFLTTPSIKCSNVLFAAARRTAEKQRAGPELRAGSRPFCIMAAFTCATAGRTGWKRLSCYRCDFTFLHITTF